MRVPEEPHPRALLAAFFVAAALILFQVSFSRLISYKLFYHFVFLAISLSMLGLGAAGTFVAVRPTPPDLDRRIQLWLALLAVSVPAAFLLIANPFGVAHHPPIRTKLLGADAVAYLLWCSPLMVWLNFCGGVVLTSLFAAHSQRMGMLYAADLLGAGVGSLACVALMKYGSPPLAFVSAVVLVVAALLPFQRALPGGDPRRRTAGAAIALGLGLSAFVFLGPPWLRNFENFRTVDGSIREVLRYEWNHIIRTDRVRIQGRDAYVLDGEASTRIEDWSGRARRRPARTPVYRISAPRPEVAIIGVGGGRQLSEALRAGASRVLAIDINPTILDWVKDEDRAITRDLFLDPRVETRVGDGRHVVRSAGRSFDVIVIHAIDTYAAAASGAYALTENFLYTREAFQDYYRALSARGVLTISRWLFNPPRENLRLFSTALAALEELGVEEPRDHLVMIAPVRRFAELGESRVWGYLLMSRQPFSPEALAALRDHVAEQGWSILYAPDRQHDTPFDALARSASRSEFQAGYPYLVSPVTDSSPYLFQYFNPLHPTAYRSSGDWATTHIYQSSSIALLVTLVLAIAASCLLIIVPLLWAKRGADASGRRPPAFVFRHGLYFAGLGVGFMALEVPIIQVLSLYLGHPTYGFSVVLVSLLVSTGVGSLWVERLDVHPGFACAGVAAVLTGVALGVFPVVHGTLSFPGPARFAIALVLVAACGVPMGLPLALGLRWLGRDDARDVAWAWGINGAASVVGACAVMIAMVFVGSRSALAASVACYAIAGTAAATWVRRPPQGVTASAASAATGSARDARRPRS